MQLYTMGGHISFYIANIPAVGYTVSYVMSYVMFWP